MASEAQAILLVALLLLAAACQNDTAARTSREECLSRVMS